MRWPLAVLLALHGLIHSLGFLKAFGLAGLPQLSGPVSRFSGVLWLVAAMGFLATAGLTLARAPFGWMVGLGAVLLSQTLVLTSWEDAKYATLINLGVLAIVLHGSASEGPLGLRGRYTADVRARSTGGARGEVVTEADLLVLPEVVRGYLRGTGSVGRPRVRSFRATWRGRIRSGSSDPWMEFTAEQHNFLEDPARFFFMDARRRGLPVDVYHAFEGGAATMTVRLLSFIPLVDAKGLELTRAETVTLFNDLCLLAPSALLDPGIRWEPVDAGSVRAFYTVGPTTISALLLFDERGDLVDFVSDDRLQASSDGSTFTPRSWSTPVSSYREVRGRRLMSRGEGRWHTPDGELVYIELELLDLETNP